MDWLQFILTSITSLTVGGVITSIVTLRYTKQKAKSEADQSAQSVVDMQIKNAQDIIDMYRSSVEDIKKMSEQREDILRSKVDELSNENKELRSEINRLMELSKDQANQLTELKKVQGQLKLKLEQLRLASENQCDYCEFKLDCKKYAAKSLKEVNKK